MKVMRLRFCKIKSTLLFFKKVVYKKPRLRLQQNEGGKKEKKKLRKLTRLDYSGIKNKL